MTFEQWYYKHGADWNAANIRPVWEAAQRQLKLDLWDALDAHEASGDTAGSLRATLLLSDVGDEIKARQR